MTELKIQLCYALPLHFLRIITSILPDNRVGIRIRGWLCSPFIHKCGNGLKLGRDVTILNSYNLTIGDNVYLAKGTWINAMGGLTLEDEVVFGPYVTISTLQHTFKDHSVVKGGSVAAPVIVKSGTWIAAHCSVKCGVTIGTGNLIAANSFVSSDTPDHMISGGVPAKTIKKVPQGGTEFQSRSEYLQE